MTCSFEQTLHSRGSQLWVPVHQLQPLAVQILTRQETAFQAVRDAQACYPTRCCLTCQIRVCSPRTSGTWESVFLKRAPRAGILIYMALVDLIAVDFVEAKRPLRVKAVGYVALFLGALSMGIIAIWA